MAEYDKRTQDNNSISKLLRIDSKSAKEEGKEEQSPLAPFELHAKEALGRQEESAGA